MAILPGSVRSRPTGVVVTTAAANGSGTGSGAKDLTKMTVADLRDECRRRGLRNYSKLKKDELIRLLRGALEICPRRENEKREQRERCIPILIGNRRTPPVKVGITPPAFDLPQSLSNLLFCSLSPNPCDCFAPVDPKGRPSEVGNNNSSAKPQERTLEELRAECRKRGMTGFSHLKKNDLIRRMEGASKGECRVVPAVKV